MAYNNRGIARYTMKDYDRALVDLDRAIAINPRDADTYNNRGNVYMDKEDIDRALADFDRAVALDPRRKSLFQSWICPAQERRPRRRVERFRQCPRARSASLLATTGARW